VVDMNMNMKSETEGLLGPWGLVGRVAVAVSGPLVSSVLGAAMWLGASGCGPGAASDGESTRNDEHADEQDDELATAETESSEGESSEGENSEGENALTGPAPPPSDMFIELACDAFLQDCPDGEKCVPYVSDGGSFNALRCVPVVGDQAVGETCHYDGPVQATDDCDELGYCWYVEGDSGVCLALCLGSPETPECPPSTSCSITGDGVVNLCIPRCDPLAQDCAEGMGCYWNSNEFQCALEGEDKLVGEACQFINSCDPGLICLDGGLLPECESESCCTAYCDLEQGDGPCAEVLPGTVCAAFLNPAPPELATVGVCILEP